MPTLRPAKSICRDCAGNFPDKVFRRRKRYNAHGRMRWEYSKRCPACMKIYEKDKARSVRGVERKNLMPNVDLPEYQVRFLYG